MNSSLLNSRIIITNYSETIFLYIHQYGIHAFEKRGNGRIFSPSLSIILIRQNSQGKK